MSNLWQFMSGAQSLRVAVISTALCLGACGGSSGGDDTIDIIDTGGGDGDGGTGGESPTTYTISGVISGANDSVTLSLNGTEETFDGASFTFTQTVESGADYTVSFITATGAQECEVTSGTGSAIADIDDVTVVCSGQVITIVTEDGEPFALEAGDFNGDGFIDLAHSLAAGPTHAVNGDLDYLRIYYGDGAGGFSDPFDTAVEDRFARVRRGKFTDDSIDDITIRNGFEFQVFEGTGNNTLNNILRITPNLDNNLTGSNTTLSSADINNDGFDDLILDTLGGSLPLSYQPKNAF